MIAAQDWKTEFRFHTYNAAGRDIVVSIWAVDIDAARVGFDHLYGNGTPVDFVSHTDPLPHTVCVLREHNGYLAAMPLEDQSSYAEWPGCFSIVNHPAGCIVV